jgi:hypothetical protein
MNVRRTTSRSFCVVEGDSFVALSTENLQFRSVMGANHQWKGRIPFQEHDGSCTRLRGAISLCEFGAADEECRRQRICAGCGIYDHGYAQYSFCGQSGAWIENVPEALPIGLEPLFLLAAGSESARAQANGAQCAVLEERMTKADQPSRAPRPIAHGQYAAMARAKQGIIDIVGAQFRGSLVKRKSLSDAAEVDARA